MRYVGEPGAPAIAEDRYAAEHALEHVAVEYRELPVVVVACVGMSEYRPASIRFVVKGCTRWLPACRRHGGADAIRAFSPARRVN